MYIVSIKGEVMTFDNRFNAFPLIRALWAANPSLDIKMVSAQTGWIHDLTWLRG